MSDKNKRLTRSRSNKMIGGVMGGLAEHYDLSPNGLRIIFMIVSILSAAFPGILVYLILWMLMPLEEKA
ncbi:MAG: PspC domain-containing protein [Dokdonella sp.]